MRVELSAASGGIAYGFTMDSTPRPRDVINFRILHVHGTFSEGSAVLMFGFHQGERQDAFRVQSKNLLAEFRISSKA